METRPVDNSDREKAVQEAVDALAWLIVRMYQLDHPLPKDAGTLPLYHGEPAGPPS